METMALRSTEMVTLSKLQTMDPTSRDDGVSVLRFGLPRPTAMFPGISKSSTRTSRTRTASPFKVVGTKASRMRRAAAGRPHARKWTPAQTTCSLAMMLGLRVKEHMQLRPVASTEGREMVNAEVVAILGSKSQLGALVKARSKAQ